MYIAGNLVKLSTVEEESWVEGESSLWELAAGWVEGERSLGEMMPVWAERERVHYESWWLVKWRNSRRDVDEKDSLWIKRINTSSAESWFKPAFQATENRELKLNFISLRQDFFDKSCDKLWSTQLLGVQNTHIKGMWFMCCMWWQTQNNDIMFHGKTNDLGLTLSTVSIQKENGRARRYSIRSEVFYKPWFKQFSVDPQNKIHIACP